MVAALALANLLLRPIPYLVCAERGRTDIGLGCEALRLLGTAAGGRTNVDFDRLCFDCRGW